jgi:serine/threonine protein kinase
LERLIEQQPAEASRGARFYTAAVLSALSHLHERDIVFRNLHPRSVLLDWAGYPRLADFTLAREVKHGQAYTLCGRLGYIAPEVLVGRGYDVVSACVESDCSPLSSTLCRYAMINEDSSSKLWQHSTEHYSSIARL